jgi:hypothetical protein
MQTDDFHSVWNEERLLLTCSIVLLSFSERIILFNYQSLLRNFQTVMFCWPASRNMRVIKPTWCTIYLDGMECSIPSRPANSRLRCTTPTNYHIYTPLPPDDGLLARPKHVGKLKIKIATSWFYYTQILKHIFSILNIKSGVVIVARLRAGLAGVGSPAWNTYFALLQNVHSGRRAYPISLSASRTAGH